LFLKGGKAVLAHKKAVKKKNQRPRFKGKKREDGKFNVIIS